MSAWLGPEGNFVRILIYGAGVIGTVYGARLEQAGHEIVVLARGERLQNVRASGLVIENVTTGKRQVSRVQCIDELAAESVYDLVVVPVRRDHLASVLEPLARSQGTPTIVFFGNNASGAGALIDRIGRERVVLGFPGAGGQLIGETVRYLMIHEQRTTLGEIDGRSSDRLAKIRLVFEGAGFPIAISADMQAWLKTHAAFVTSVAAAVYAAHGDARAVASDPALGAPDGASHPRGIPDTPPSRRPRSSMEPASPPRGPARVVRGPLLAKGFFRPARTVQPRRAFERRA
jgi:2-dehydropantoate 2-reductase